MIAWLKVYLVLAAGVLALIAAVVIPIAICTWKQGPAQLQTAFNPAGPPASPQAAFKRLGRTPNGEILVEAVKYLVSRKMEGRLPGIASDAQLGIDFPWLFRNRNDGRWHFITTNLENYPIRLTFTLHANAAANGYRYTIAKISRTNDWQLERAYLSDTNGRILKEFSIH